MKFLLDESADIRLASYLQGLNHDVKVVAKDFKPSIPDSEVLAIALKEDRVLITFDRDFGELVFKEKQLHKGILYFRLGPIDLSTEISRLNYVLENYAKYLNKFITITGKRVRVKQ